MPVSASLEDLTTPLTVDEVRESFYNVLAALGVNTTVWKPGAVVRTIIAASAIVIAAMSTLMAKIAKSGFLELAEGEWLTLVAYYVYGVERVEAGFASGNVEISNAGGGVFDYDPDELTFENSATGQQYTNTSAVHIGSNEQDVVVPVRSREVGTDATAFVGEIDTIVPGVNNLSVTNPATLIGTDAETDPNLRLRCNEKLGSLSPMGPSDAYGYAARNAKRLDGTSVGVTRIRTTKDGYGNVYVYVATASGAVPGSASDPTTDLGAVNEAIQHNAAALGDTAHTLAAVPVAIAVNYSIWLYNSLSLTQEQIENAIEAELADFMASQPIGGNIIGTDPGKIFTSAISAAIARAKISDVSSLRGVKVQVNLPASDVPLAISEVPTLGTVASNDLVLLAAQGSS